MLAIRRDADGRDADGRRRVRVLAAIALACVVLLGALYLLSVRTDWGQRLDDAALGGRVVARPRVQRAMNELLDTISVSSLAMLGLGIMAIAWFRERRHLAFAAGVVIVGSVVTTEILKRAVFTRPDLGNTSALSTNIFPSGHATVAMSLGMALIIVASPRWRGIAALAGAAYGTLVGVAVLGAGWHRPSDAIGAYLVVTAWTSGAAALVHVRHGYRRERAKRPSISVVTPLFGLAGGVILGAAFFVLAGVLLAFHRGRLDAVKPSAAYLTGSAAIAGAGLALTAVLLFALRGIDLDEPAHEHSAEVVGA